MPSPFCLTWRTPELPTLCPLPSIITSPVPSNVLVPLDTFIPPVIPEFNKDVTSEFVYSIGAVVIEVLSLNFNSGVLILTKDNTSSSEIRNLKASLIFKFILLASGALIIVWEFVKNFNL